VQKAAALGSECSLRKQLRVSSKHIFGGDCLRAAMTVDGISAKKEKPQTECLRPIFHIYKVRV